MNGYQYILAKQTEWAKNRKIDLLSLRRVAFANKIQRSLMTYNSRKSSRSMIASAIIPTLMSLSITTRLQKSNVLRLSANFRKHMGPTGTAE